MRSNHFLKFSIYLPVNNIFLPTKITQEKIADKYGESTSSETRGQIVGTRESLNGRENVARRKVKNGEKSSSRRSLRLFSPFFTFLRSIYIFPPV